MVVGGVSSSSSSSGRHHRWKTTNAVVTSLLVIISSSLFLILPATSAVAAAAAAATAAVANDNDGGRGKGTITCATGWGSNGEQLIVSEQINDGYCDCPIDGKDEPDTQACSGSNTWPGSNSNNDDIVEVEVEQHEDSTTTTTTTFQCPQQPDMKLPLSRVNDGICDCCDGADEKQSNNDNKCKDNCEEVLRAQRMAKEAAIINFTNGSNRRNMELDNYHTIRSLKLHEVQELEDTLSNLDKTEIIETEIESLKQDYMMVRMATMKGDVVTKSGISDIILNSILSSSSSSSNDDDKQKQKEQLQGFIIHACQMDGEMSSTTDNGNVCVSLRLAGLDMGITWGDDNYNHQRQPHIKRNDNLNELATILFENASHDTSNWKPINNNNKNKNKKHNNRGARRRLDEIYDDVSDFDHDHGDYDYRGDHHYHRDDYEEFYGSGSGSDNDDEDEDEDDWPDIDDHDDNNNNNNNNERTTSSTQWNMPGGKEGEMMTSVREMPFSKIRVLFMNRAKEVITNISNALEGKNMSSQDDERKAGEEEEKEEEADDAEAAAPATKFDPAAYSMVKSSLRRKGNAIFKGWKWGASAKLLFDDQSNDLSVDELKQLAIGTVYHGTLASLHVWEILQSIVPELLEESNDGTPPKESCSSPWAAVCPPRMIQGKSGESLPSSILIQEAEKFCSMESELAAMPGRECGEDEEDPSVIPTSIPSEGGYYGYYLPIPRTEQDPLDVYFQPMDSLPVDSDRAETLKKQVTDLQNQRSDLEKKIQGTLRDVGGRDGTGLGPDGELHALKDECYSMTAGKYTYEVCIFGKASQRDVPKVSGGTDLGRWNRMDKDEVTGERTMYWEGGAKCWNGPSRSATVYVTCGAETKLISADEPETCKYVFDMESHIACDEQYKERMGLY